MHAKHTFIVNFLPNLGDVTDSESPEPQESPGFSIVAKVRRLDMLLLPASATLGALLYVRTGETRAAARDTVWHEITCCSPQHQGRLEADSYRSGHRLLRRSTILQGPKARKEEATRGGRRTGCGRGAPSREAQKEETDKTKRSMVGE